MTPCDPDNRLVARELETRWNTALPGARDARAGVCRRAAGRLGAVERRRAARGAPVGRRPAGGLGRRTTTAGRPQAPAAAGNPGGQRDRACRTGAGSAAVTMLWSGGADDPAYGDLPADRLALRHRRRAVARIRHVGPAPARRPDRRQLNVAGVCTQTGKPGPTSGSGRSATSTPSRPPARSITEARAVRGDGMMPVRAGGGTARGLTALIHVWIGQGELQSVRPRCRLETLGAADETRSRAARRQARLEPVPDRCGAHAPGGLEPRRRSGSGSAAGQYVAYRHADRRCWEWRLRPAERWRCRSASGRAQVLCNIFGETRAIHECKNAPRLGALSGRPSRGRARAFSWIRRPGWPGWMRPARGGSRIRCSTRRGLHCGLYDRAQGTAPTRRRVLVGVSRAQGRLRKIYLGTSAAVTEARLEEIAATLRGDESANVSVPAFC